MKAPKPCSLCGRDPATGYAGIDDRFYCHGDDDPEPTCFMRAQWSTANTGNVDGWLVEILAEGEWTNESTRE